MRIYVFGWLNAAATICHLRKMTVTTIQRQCLLQRNNDGHGYYSKTRQFCGTNSSICYNTTLFYSKLVPSSSDFH